MKFDELALSLFVRSQLAPPELPRNLHQVLFATFSLCFCLIGSVYFYITGNGDHFSRFGSAILALAFIQVAVSRARFHDSKLAWDRYRAFVHINETKRQLHFLCDSLDLTFDMLTAEIEQLYRETKTQRISPRAITSLDDLLASITHRLIEARHWTESVELLKDSKEFEARYRAAMTEIEDWQRLLFRLEGTLLVWGTIQWGWGDLLFA